VPETISPNATPAASTPSAPAPVDSATPAASPGASGSGGPGADSSSVPANTDASKPAADVKPLPDKAIEPLPKFPTPEEVDWDKWDGKPDTLPEMIRPWYDRFGGRHQKELKSVSEQRDHFQTLFNSLSFGEDDPRIGELTGKVQTYEQKVAEYEARIAEFERAEDERLNTEARSDVDKFWSENPDIKADAALQTKLGELVNGGWHYRDAAKLLKMPEDIQAWANEQLQAGVPAAKVVEYAEDRNKFRRPAAPKPRPHADLVTGNGPVSKPAVEEKETPLDLSSAESFEKWRNERVRKTVFGTGR
jgi:hypothetical protein